MKLAALALLVGACAAPQRPRHARVVLRCPDTAAEVTVDGVPAGTARDYDGHPGRLQLAPGVHRIVLRGSGGRQEVRELQVGPEDDLALSVALPAGGSP